MKKISLVLGCMLLCVSLAFAEGKGNSFKTNRFPGMLPAKKAVKPAAMAAPQNLNEDKELGLKMWAVTMTDYNNDPGFVYFYSSKPYELNKTGIIKSREEDEFRLWHMLPGATWHNGEYLGYTYMMYTYVNHVKGFVSVDLEKGTYTVKHDMSEQEDQFDFMEGMSTNPKTGELMGMARNRDATNVTSNFGVVNPETGEFTVVQALEQYYFSIAYDAFGTLWAVRWNGDKDGNINGSRLVVLDPENNYAEKSEVALKLDGSNFKMYWQNSIYFDPVTGDLWILAANTDGYQYLCKVNTKTGEMEKSGSFGFRDIAAGLYIPGTKPDATGAANRVEKLTSTFDDKGVVTLKWTNPSTAFDKTALTELAEVLVYRDGTEDANLVATITENVAVGAEMTWTDTDASTGVHVYYVIPCRVKGEKGVMESWRAFTGRDVPGMVENVTLTKNSNTSLTLKWEKPKFGKNDGWFDQNNITYNVVRYPDKKKVATGVTETELTDNELGNIELYYYLITAVTSDGEGVATTSPQVMAGSSYKTPYSTEFVNKAEADQWTVVDANQDGTKFDYRDYMEPYGLMMYASEFGSNDYVISPAISMKGGTTYKVKFNVYFHYSATDYDPERFQTFSITAGAGTTAEAQNIELKKWDNFQHFNYYETLPFEAFFTPEKDGDYNVAYRFFDSPVYDVIVVTGASVEEVFDNDLAAMSLEGTLNPAKGAASDYTVKVKNEGGKAVNSYKVQVVRLDGAEKVVIGETEVNEALESQKETDVKVSVTPDVEGDAEFAANVVLQGDQNDLNNTTEPMLVSIAAEGTIPINYTVTNGDEGVNTRVPMSFMKYGSYSQCIYHASEMKIAGAPKIHRLAFKYDTYTAVDNFDVVVYLTTTTKEGFDDEAQDWEWTPVAEQTKVYEGKQSILSGTGNMMVFDLETPFEFDPTKNLMVTVFKKGDSSDQFPAMFQTYNSSWVKPYRTLRYETQGESEPIGDATSSGCTVVADLPVLYLAVKDLETTGITELVIGDAGISYSDGKINFNGVDAVSVAVYDLTGRVMLDTKVAANVDAVNASLVQGVYVVKVVARDGKVYTTKIRVAK